MSTRDTPARPVRLAAGFAAALVVLPTVVLVLRKLAPGDMWLGCLVGGVVTIVGLGGATLRAWRSPSTVSTAERVVTVHADERDRAVRTRTLATVGAAALPLASAACVAVALGAPAAPTLTLLLWALLAILVGAFLWADR